MIDLIIFAVLMTIAFGAGRWNEKRHYKSIREREQRLIHIPVVTQKRWKATPKPDNVEVIKTGLVTGQVVMGVDSFRVFLGGILQFFGGRVKPYESLLDRARREAILRAKEKATKADLITNMRIETSVIGRGSVEIVAYATAVKFQQKSTENHPEAIF